MSQYSFPIQSDWTTDEMIDVVDFLAAIEKAYEQGIALDELSIKYQKFKQVVTSISAEKRMGRDFKQASGYEIYPVVKKLKALEKIERENPKSLTKRDQWIKMS